jgi:hypothetical protein
MRKFPYVLVVVVCVAAILAGCNLPFLVQDTAGVQTAAALTVQAQLSPVASVTSTFTPAPFPSLPPASSPTPANTLPPAPTSTSNCDNASFIADVTIPDNTPIGAGDSFTKTWRLKNIGACSWTPSYALVFLSGASMNGPAVQALVGNVNPGQTVDLSVNLTGPGANGTYTGNWGLRNGAGVIFSHFYVQIVVGSGGGGGAFSVTHVTYNVTGSCGNFHIKANVTTNGAGTVTYYWEFNGNDPDEGTYGSTLVFSSAGTKTTPVLDWSISAPGANYAQVYIDSPNHQFIGQADAPCP